MYSKNKLKLFSFFAFVFSVYCASASEVTHEGRLKKQDGEWSVENFDSVKADDNFVTITAEKILKDMQSKFGGSVGGTMGALMEQDETLADFETKGFVVTGDGKSYSFEFLRAGKRVKPSELPDGIDVGVKFNATYVDGKDQKVQASNLQATSITPPSSAKPAAGGGCASNGSSLILFPLLLLLWRRNAKKPA